jgi:hypothetical protein
MTRFEEYADHDGLGLRLEARAAVRPGRSAARL